jgi:nickel-type superoxide dismutase maturation protease
MQDLLFRFSPLFIFHIQGSSMLPLFKSGETVLVVRFTFFFFRPKLQDIVIAKDPRDGKFLLKRITAIEKEKFFLSGDNKSASTDSREFGMIDRSGLIGKIICKV